MQSFVKIKPSQISDITLSFTDIGKSCPVRDFLRRKCVFNAFRENKILAKISEFTVIKQDGVCVDALCVSQQFFSVMSRRFPVLLRKSTKQEIKCLAQEHNTVPGNFHVSLTAFVF